MNIKTWAGTALWLVSTMASSATVVLTQSTSQVPVTHQRLSCVVGSITSTNSYWRAYDLAPLRLNGPLTIHMVEFGIELSQAGLGASSQPVTVKVHTSAGAFPGGALTLRASQGVDLPNLRLTKVQVPLTTPTVPLPVDSIVVLEVAVPDGVDAQNQLFFGSNPDGQSGPGYLSAAACSILTPRTFDSFNRPNIHIILNATGTTPNTLPENLACAANAINALPPASLAPTAAKSKTTLLDLVNTATAYQASRYWSLSLAAVRSALVRTDGCALRGSPDTTGDADLITSCTAQAPIYACLKGAETQLTTPPPGK